MANLATKKQSKKTAMLSAAVYLIMAAIIYYVVFYHTDKLVEVLKSKTYFAPLLCMTTVVVVSFLYGTAISNILKHTLQERLKSQELREE